jgi:hypothetical protein
MLAEFEADILASNVYTSTRFTEHGHAVYPDRMRAAIETGSESTLAEALRGQPCFVKEELRRGKPVSVPHTAQMTFAEGEFNRYYARGVCLRAFDDSVDVVEVYRAKQVTNSRPQSDALLGQRLPAGTLLDDLRLHTGVETALGLPPGPNSGLSVFCVCSRCC